MPSLSLGCGPGLGFGPKRLRWVSYDASEVCRPVVETLHRLSYHYIVRATVRLPHIAQFSK